MQAKQVFTKMIPTLLRYLSAVYISTLSISKAHADVNLQQASYYKTWTDFSVQSKNVKYSFHRTYKSRSIHQGLFGFGWCTDFEKNLDLNNKMEIVLQDCQEERFLKFKKIGNNYVSTEDPKDKILLVGDQFQRQKGLITQVFDAEGRLIRLQFFKWPLEIFYGSDHRISFIKINHDQIISLKFTPRNGDVLTVMAPGKAAFVYHLNHKNLISVTSGSNTGSKIEYTYSAAHNLIRIEQAGKTTESLVYDEQKDWLLESRKDSVCKETFNYQADAKKPLHFKTTVQKICANIVKSETEYTYELVPVSSGSYRIARSLTKQQNGVSRFAQKNGVLNE